MIWFIMRNTVFEYIGAYSYIIDMMLCASVLYMLALQKGKVSSVLASKKMVYMGGISLYIFISHYLIGSYVDTIVKYLKIESVFTAIIEVLVILGLTFIVSVWLDKRHN